MPGETTEVRKDTVTLISKLRLLNIFPGDIESAFYGPAGLEFANLREYEPGEDDPRDIDLLVSPRPGEEYVVDRIELRELRVYVWSDFSESIKSSGPLLFARKPVIRDIALGLILFSAIEKYCSVALYPFGLKKRIFFPPRMGEGYGMKLWNWTQQEAGQLEPSSLGVEGALSDILRYAAPHNLVFFISDFQQRVFDGEFTRLLRPIAHRFDFIPVVIRDPLESGRLHIDRSVRIEAQSGRVRKQLLFSPRLLKEIQESSSRHLQHLERNFKKIGLDHIVLDSTDPEECWRSFARFFAGRR